MHGFVVAAVNSGAGKSTVTLGLLAALCRRKYRVQSFKVGPDFIDTALHGVVTGRPSYNLDRWMCGDQYIKRLFWQKTRTIDVVVVEGVMGVFDGALASTAEVAKVLGLPVVLVLDVKAMAETAAALVQGVRELDRDLRIAGVILNRVASARHLAMVKDSIEKRCGVPVFGFLPRSKELTMPQRHLGLYTAEEGVLTTELIDRFAEYVEEHVDLQGLVDRCRVQAPAVDEYMFSDSKADERPTRLAIARDRAFCFYYEDGLEMLKEAGVECVAFSPLEDETLPENISGLYIGGGYPELYAEVLSANKAMIRAIREFVLDNGVVYAECGGFMYLMEGIYDTEGRFYPMVGVFPLRAKMRKSRFSLGYREVFLTRDVPIGRKGSAMRGHEFHYSEIAQWRSDVDDVYYPGGGFLINNCLGSYIHIHFGSNGNIIKTLKETLHRRGGVYEG